jgi:hypothetical protein
LTNISILVSLQMHSSLGEYILALRILSIIILLTVSSVVVFVAIAAAQQQQENYSFITKWGSEGSGPGQFMGQNDVAP